MYRWENVKHILERVGPVWVVEEEVVRAEVEKLDWNQAVTVLDCYSELAQDSENSGREIIRHVHPALLSSLTP